MTFHSTMLPNGWRIAADQTKGGRPVRWAVFLMLWQEKGGLLVAIDAVGAGEGEVVMLVGGSSSRQTNITENKPVDQSIVAIIDSVDLNGTRIFEKFSKES